MNRKYTLSAEIERALRHHYAGTSDNPRRNGGLAGISKHLGVPRWRLTRWAVELGLVQPKRKEPRWTPEEVRLLERWGHLGLLTIARKFAKAGYRRTPVAVKIQLRRREIRPSADGYTGRQVALAFGVDEKTVRRWIVRGMLRAKRRGTLRTSANGGDHYWITDRAIRRFVFEYLAEIPLGTVCREWFVSLLVGGHIGHRERSDGE